jgi:hypothetical protein
MQPDDARPEGAKLDPALDNHIIATSGWNGFPAFIPGEAVYQDTIANATVPNVVGVDATAAQTAIEAVSLVYAEAATTTDGATAENDGLVASQTPVAGTVVNEGTTVTVSLYEFVA